MCRTASADAMPTYEPPGTEAAILAVAIVLLVATLAQMRRALEPVMPVIRAALAAIFAVVLGFVVLALLLTSMAV
jgi:hypothetical protein